MNTSQGALLLGLILAALVLIVVSTRQSRQNTNSGPQPTVLVAATALAQTTPPPRVSVTEPMSAPSAIAVQTETTEPVEEKPAVTNKLDRLAQIRETFRALATGNKTNALRAAKQIADETERETALLTLVTEWTQGELGPPRLRAGRIASLGLEAGLGFELAKNPELAWLWADELTEGVGRTVLLQETARFLVDSDPAAAFALSQRLPEADRRNFSDAIFANWASHDTDAALKWADQFSDATEREAAIQAIRTSAPVGIGTALRIQDGYPVINELVQGMPAERSGQLSVGDRIVAIAQGGGDFVDLKEVPLADIVGAIRGAPNTMLQLQVVPAGAAPNTPPKTVLIVRDQIKFKR